MIIVVKDYKKLTEPEADIHTHFEVWHSLVHSKIDRYQLNILRIWL